MTAPAPLVAITGATGFVGRHLAAHLRAKGWRVRLLLRRPVDGAPDADSVVIGDIARPLNLAQALAGVDAVVHSAGIAHAMSGRPADDYRQVNREATIELAKAARRAGARRFVFLSSVRAQTGPTATGILTESLKPEPTDAYGRSKLEAEEGLAELDLDWAALRPVIVYGAGALGNVATLIRLARTPLPLPLGGIRGRRSLVSLETLADAVTTVLNHEGPLRRPFLVADDGPLRIGEMIGALRRGMGRAPLVLPLPQGLLRLAAAAAGKSEGFSRAAGDLMVDTSALRTLGWQPRSTAREGLERLGRTLTR